MVKKSILHTTIQTHIDKLWGKPDYSPSHRYEVYILFILYMCGPNSIIYQ